MLRKPLTGPALARRTGALIAAIAVAVLTTVSPAAAAPPVVLNDVVHSTGGRWTTTDGTIEFSASYSTLIGPRGGLTYIGPLGDMNGPEGFAEMVGNRLIGEYSLIDSQTGDFAGWATYEIDFTPAGEATTTQDVIRDGNVRSVLELATRPMLATGVITLPDGTQFPFTDLPATNFIAEQWSTQPEARILDGSETLIDATWWVDGRPVTFRANVTELSADAAVFTIEDVGEIIGTARPTFVDDHLDLAVTLARSDGSPAGSARVSLDVIDLGTSFGFEQTEISRRRVMTTEIMLIGEMEMTVDGVTRTFDFAEVDELVASRQSWHGLQFPHASDGEG